MYHRPRLHSHSISTAGTFEYRIGIKMSSRTVFFIAILVVGAFPACSSLKGGENAVCLIQRDRDQRASPTGSSEYLDYEYGVDAVHPTRHYGEEHESSNKIVEDCCPGYTNKNDVCEPLCESGCENGFCSEPNKCTCNDGYEKTPMDDCVPTCGRVCINGVCSVRSCEPVCSNMTCENGYCMEDNVCGCNRGYRKNTATNSCDPICKARCELDASCTAPETCTCNDGFVREKAENGSCVSACEPSCHKGVCTSKGCDCSYGWGGILCDEQLYCVLNLSANLSLTEARDKLRESNQVKPTDENDQLESKFPACEIKCLDQLNDTSKNVTRLSGQTIQYFISIEASCNVVEDEPEPSQNDVMEAAITIAAFVVSSIF